MAEMRAEEALEFLITHLAVIPSNINRHALAATRYAHLYLPDLVARFWNTRTPTVGITDLSDAQYTVFYDAAWELARIGVLRPGRVAPRNQVVANDFGDHWSITAFGFEWLAKASSRSFIDMSRMSEVLAGFVPLFGAGFASARSRQSAPIGPLITSHHVRCPARPPSPYCSLRRLPKAAMRRKC